VAVIVCAVPRAAAAQPVKKAIWGPAKVEGRSQFPVYRDLGVGIYQAKLDWNTVAPTRPERPRDPSDAAYRWPEERRFAIREARRYGIRVALQIVFSPPWANGGRTREWAPRPRAFADRAPANVDVLGAVPAERVPQLYAGADAAVVLLRDRPSSPVRFRQRCSRRWRSAGRSSCPRAVRRLSW
jgi:hypothetical protein